MKLRTITLLLCCLYFFIAHTQVNFVTVLEGDIVTTLSDSRSCNFVDVDNDGWDDIFISNGPSSGQDNLLYRNNGDGTFTTETSDPIVQDNGKSDGATFADVDNDGDLDAMVVTWHGQINFFYRNNGDGSFTYESDAPMGMINTYSETASWGDYDNDGWLDLYVSNSGSSTALKRNQLFQNDGAGEFERIEEGAWVTDARISRSVNWVDFDGDGDIDLFVSNESNQKNDLYENVDGTFTALTDHAIVADQRSSMGSSWADVDNDGDLDLFVANYNQNNQLFINQGSAGFEAMTEGDLVTDGGRSFGSSFADYDNDGDVDLCVANGYGPNLQNFLYLNDGQGNFTRDITSIADLTTQCSFGCAWGDYDNDGFVDLLISTCVNTGQSQVSNFLYHNEGNENNWVKVKLEGTTSNRTAIGARIRLKATIDGTEVWQMRELSAQSGYCGQNSLTTHFGIGNAELIDSLIVEWPSGLKNYRIGVPANEMHLIVEEVINASDEQILAAKPLHFTCTPNPTDDQLIVSGIATDENDEFYLQLIDSLGKVWLQEKISSDGSGEFNRQLNLKQKAVSSGTYYVKISNSKLVGVQKIIVR